MQSRVGSARSPHAPRDTLHKPSHFRGRPRLWEGLARFFLFVLMTITYYSSTAVWDGYCIVILNLHLVPNVDGTTISVNNIIAVLRLYM